MTPFLWLCITGGLAIFSSTMSKNPTLPLFIHSLGVDKGSLGFIAAASTVVGIVASLPAGVLSDLWGRRQVIPLSMVIFATAPFLYLLVRVPWHLVLVRIYHGLATALLGPVALASVADTFQERRGERMGWYSSATMIGRFLAPTAGGLLIFGEGFRWVYLGCGAAGGLALLTALQLPQQSRSAQPGPSGARWATMRRELRLILNNRSLLLTSGVEAAQCFALGAVETFLPLYLKELGWEPRVIGPLFTAQVLVTAATRPLMGRLSDCGDHRLWPIVAGLLLGAGVMTAMPWVHAWWLMAVLIALFGLGMAAVTSSTSALVSDLSRAAAYGASLGVLSSVMDVGHSTGPMVTGLLVAAWGYGPAFALVAALLVICTFIFATLMYRARNQVFSEKTWFL
ncbi:MAG: MFS transporter [Chloroflexota bacterium]|nr:MFS transporter [Chloroflexota bacterium]